MPRSPGNWFCSPRFVGTREISFDDASRDDISLITPSYSANSLLDAASPDDDAQNKKSGR